MNLWLPIIAAMALQEFFTENVVFINAHRLGYSIWIIFALFILITSITISAGFFLGKCVQMIFKSSKLVSHIEKRTQRYSKALGARGGYAALLILGLANFSYVSAFLVSWFAFSFLEVYCCLFIGASFWFGVELILVYGLGKYIGTKYVIAIAIFIFIAIVSLVTFIDRIMFKKTDKDR